MYTNHDFDERNFIFLPHICQRDNVISQKKKVSEGMIYSARARVNMINSALCRALRVGTVGYTATRSLI